MKLVVPLPPPNTEPPVAVAYQSIVSPVPGVAEIVETPFPQRDTFVAVGATGFTGAVKITVPIVCGPHTAPFPKRACMV